MNQGFSDELISAYLDGELTPQEQARVEQILMDSREHRRTFEELRSLRNSLKDLPSYRLDDAFAERVLRRAERAMLAGPTKSEPKISSTVAAQDSSQQDASDKDEDEQLADTKPAAVYPGNWRTAVLAVAAVAAAFVFSILYVPNSEPRQVNSVALDASDHADAFQEGAERDPQALADENVANGDYRFESQPPSGSPSAASDLQRPSQNRGRATNAIPEGKGVEEFFFETPRGTDVLKKRASPSQRTSSQTPMAPAEAGADASPRADIEVRKRFGGRDEARRMDQSAPRPDGSRSQTTPRPESLQAAPTVATTPSADDTLSTRGQYVVLVDVARNTFQREVLNETLDRSGIMLGKAVQDQFSQKRGWSFGNSALAETEAETDAERAQDMRRIDKTEKGEDVLEVIAVSATWQQVEAACADLKRDGYVVSTPVHRESGEYGSLSYGQQSAQDDLFRAVAPDSSLRREGESTRNLSVVPQGRSKSLPQQGASAARGGAGGGFGPTDPASGEPPNSSGSVQRDTPPKRPLAAEAKDGATVPSDDDQAPIADKEVSRQLKREQSNKQTNSSPVIRETNQSLGTKSAVPHNSSVTGAVIPTAEVPQSKGQDLPLELKQNIAESQLRFAPRPAKPNDLADQAAETVEEKVVSRKLRESLAKNRSAGIVSQPSPSETVDILFVIRAVDLPTAATGRTKAAGSTTP